MYRGRISRISAYCVSRRLANCLVSFLPVFSLATHVINLELHNLDLVELTKDRHSTGLACISHISSTTHSGFHTTSNGILKHPLRWFPALDHPGKAQPGGLRTRIRARLHRQGLYERASWRAHGPDHLWGVVGGGDAVRVGV